MLSDVFLWERISITKHNTLSYISDDGKSPGVGRGRRVRLEVVAALAE